MHSFFVFLPSLSEINYNIYAAVQFIRGTNPLLTTICFTRILVTNFTVNLVRAQTR